MQGKARRSRTLIESQMRSLAPTTWSDWGGMRARAHGPQSGLPCRHERGRMAPSRDWGGVRAMAHDPSRSGSRVPSASQAPQSGLDRGCERRRPEAVGAACGLGCAMRAGLWTVFETE